MTEEHGRLSQENRVSSSIRIALASTTLVSGDATSNLRAMEDELARLHGQGVDLFVFPELNLVGGPPRPKSSAELLEVADFIPAGKSCSAVCDLARKYGATICAGMVERDAGKLFMTHFLCGPSGFIGKQRKFFPSNPDKPGWADAGGCLEVIDYRGFRLAILACADFLLPEPAILAGLAGCSLIICPTDSFDLANGQIAQKLLTARALDIGAHAVAVFGHQSHRNAHREEEVVAGIACSPHGEVLLNETCKASEARTSILDVTLTVTPHRTWGNAKVRSGLLWRNLGFHAADTTMPRR